MQPFKGIFCDDISELESSMPIRQSGLRRFGGAIYSCQLEAAEAAIVRYVSTARPNDRVLSCPRQPLSRGSSPCGCPHEPLVSYQINRQLSGWNLPPLVMRAFGALCQIPT